MNTLYTIGHSNGSLEELLALLKAVDINCVVDVRSIPASSYTPQFNKECLSRFLKQNKIYYLHFSEEFGARRNDAIVNGQVNFEKAATTTNFLNGVSRINDGLEKGFRIAFMCSEADPLSCHRFALVARYFNDNGYDVKHILHSGIIKTHAELEREMIFSYLEKKKSKLPDYPNLLDPDYTEEDQKNDAYKLKNIEIGYKAGFSYNNEI